MPPSKARGGGSGGQRGAVRTIIQPKQHHRAQAAVLVRPTPTPSPSEESPAPQEEEQQQPKKRKCPLEQAPPLEVHQRFYALSQQRCTGAYDDDRQQQQQQQQSRSKRQKTVQQEQERSGKRSRDEMEKPVRKPDYCDRYIHGHGGAAADLAMMRLPRALRNGNGQQQRQQSDPVASMGLLGWLPAETRDQILRYVLVWPQDIRVLQGWSLVFPRTRPHLEVAILRTCEVLRRQGARILYGENRFVHLVRDPPAANAATPHVLREVYGGSWIPVRRYGHLIRDVAIVVEANRMADREHRQNFVRSIAKLGPGGGLPFPANLHTVTIEVPALAIQDLNGWHASDSDLSSVPICEFFDEKAVKALTSLNTKFVRVLATDRYGRLLESVIDLRYYSTKLHHDNINNNNNNDEHLGEDDPATRDQVLMDSREERARKAMARLRTIRYNLQLLTLYPRKAIKERRIWTVVQREKPNIEIFELAEDHIDIDELESPSPQPPKKRVKNKQLTEKWLEQTEAANGEDADAMDTNSPLDNLEKKLNRLKVASPAKATTATTSSARKGKAKATTVAAPKIKLRLKASKSKKPTAATAAEVTPTSAEASKKKPKGKKPSKDESRPPLSDAAQKRMNERINSINQKAAPAVAAMKADRIAAEKKKAAEEAAAAAREAMKSAERDAAEMKKRADEAMAAYREAVAVAKQANAELEAATQGSRQGSGRGRENQVATTGRSSASSSQNLAQSQEQASFSSSSASSQQQADGDGDVSMGL